MNIIKNVYGDVTYLTFPILEQEHIVHGFSTRLGGISEGELGAMNLSFSRGDVPARVMENHHRFAEAVGFSEKKLVFSDQVHKMVVRRVDSSDCGKGIFCESDIKEVDGLVTDDPDVVLMTFFADCVPLFLYDPVHRAIGAIHSGWRGTVGRIGARAVLVMREEFGTDPKDIRAVIGPSICQDCYEVSEDVADSFRKEFTPSQMNELLISKKNHKYQLNLWRANEMILREAGVPDKGIQVSGLCTCCHPDFLFSHRASGGKRGNLAGAISLGYRRPHHRL